MIHRRPIDHEHALLALNDRFGQQVQVSVDVDLGHSIAPVMMVYGVLTHWHARFSPGTAAWPTHPREDMVGLYEVGGVAVDVTDIPSAHLLIVNGEERGLAFQLKDGVELTIVWDAGAGED